MCDAPPIFLTAQISQIALLAASFQIPSDHALVKKLRSGNRMQFRVNDLSPARMQIVKSALICGMVMIRNKQSSNPFYRKMPKCS